jgi:hypothetical protein
MKIYPSWYRMWGGSAILSGDGEFMAGSILDFVSRGGSGINYYPCSRRLVTGIECVCRPGGTGCIAERCPVAGASVKLHWSYYERK